MNNRGAAVVVALALADRRRSAAGQRQQEPQGLAPEPFLAQRLRPRAPLAPIHPPRPGPRSFSLLAPGLNDRNIAGLQAAAGPGAPADADG